MMAMQSAVRRQFTPAGLSIMVLTAVFAVQALVGEGRVPPENRLILRQLEVRGGMIYQLVTPSEGEAIRGKWAAQIFDAAGGIVCGGGGYAPYTAKLDPVAMSPDVWAGGSCALVEGASYRAVAAWEWTGPNGSVRRLSGEIEFIHDPRGVHNIGDENASGR